MLMAVAPKLKNQEKAKGKNLRTPVYGNVREIYMMEINTSVATYQGYVLRIWPLTKTKQKHGILIIGYPSELLWIGDLFFREKEKNAWV
jgi:hypothetical protein